MNRPRENPIPGESPASRPKKHPVPDALFQIQRRISGVLASAGMAEAAATLCRECGDRDGSARLILGQALEAAAFLSAGDVAAAVKLLDKIKPEKAALRKMDHGLYHFALSWRFLLEADAPSTAKHLEIAMKSFTELGAPFPLAVCRYWEAQAFFEQGRLVEAGASLDHARRIARQSKSMCLEFICLLAESQFALGIRAAGARGGGNGASGADKLRLVMGAGDTDVGRHGPASAPVCRSGCEHGTYQPDIPFGEMSPGGDGAHKSPLSAQEAYEASEKHGLAALRKAMRLGREQGYANMLGWRSDVMPRLCVKALEAGIEVEYVRELIRRRNLFPEVLPIQCENWPWPIKILTLGRFVVLREDKPLQFTRKVQQKPLEMLMAILSIGNGEIHERRLIESLWPNVESDTAYHAYEATLHRLRRLLDVDGAVKRQGGQVSLDRRHCWVDAWAFERMVEPGERSAASLSICKLGKAKRAQQPAATAGDVRAAEKALNVYKGHFLPEDDGRVWTIFTRMRLQNKFRDVAASLGDYLEQTGQWKKAAAHYQKVIEVDGLAEAFYRRLMVCYQNLGLRAQGVEVYLHLKKALYGALEIFPSPETEIIHQALCDKDNRL